MNAVMTAMDSFRSVQEGLDMDAVDQSGAAERASSQGTGVAGALALFRQSFKVFIGLGQVRGCC